jgi:outer membrane cobalamin receptor
MKRFLRVRALCAPCVVGVALFCASPALADNAAPAPSPSPSGPPEIGHVVTSDRQDEPASVSARTTFVVDKAEMVEHGWLNVGDAIEAVPGVQLIRYGSIGSQISAEIRGASSDQVLVLLNGLPVPGANLGGVDLSQYSTSGIDRIEVVEGPGATLYGSGAVGGVINIITTGANSPNARDTNALIGGGSYDERNASIESRNFSFQSLSATNDYGYTLPDGTSGVRQNADDRELHGSANYAATLGPIDVTLTGLITDQHLGVPGELGFLTAGERQNDGLEDLIGSFAYHSAESTVSLDLTGSRERINSIDTDPADAETAGTFNGTSLEARSQVSLRNVVGTGASRLIYGLDLSRESVRNDDGFGDLSVAALSQSALYVQENVQVAPGSRVYAGVRGENDGGFGQALSPSVGAVVALGDAFSLRVNGATAFRAPTADELYYPDFGNPLLHPERTSGGDVTLSDDRILGGASIGWFVQNGRDLISYDAAANTDVNISQSSIAGYILTLATRPLHGVTAKLNLTDTYRALDLTTEAVRLTYRPVIVSNVEIAYAPMRQNVLDAIGFVAHSEGLRDPAGALPFTRVDGFLRVRVAPRALISVRAINLGNEQYQTVAGYPAVGRAFTVDLATR